MLPRYRTTFTSDPRNVALARNGVAGFARDCGFPEADVDDIRLAVGEAISNAAEHGRGVRDRFTVSCFFQRGQLFVEVQDGGNGFDEKLLRVQAPDERGRGFGLTIMRGLMDSIAYSRHGTRVRMVKRLG